MAEALRLDIVIDESGAAKRALDEFSSALKKAGVDAESAAKQVEKFEKEYLDAAAAAKKATAEQDKATTATKQAGAAAEGAAAAKGKQATATTALTSAVMRYAAPAAIGAAALKTLEWADNLVNLSKSTGISITNLQKFEQIGKASGATMDQIASASLQLSNRIAGGDKSAAMAIEKMGLSLDKLKAGRPDETMLSLARALSKVEDPQERVALATDAMGRSGAALLPTLLEMADKWDKISAKLDEKGVKALADANNALGEMWDTGKMVLASVLVPFAPLLTGISTILTPLSSLMREFMGFVTAPLNLSAWQEWAGQLRDVRDSVAMILGMGKGMNTDLPGLPGAPGAPFMPSGLPVPGDPMGGVGGQSWSFLNRFTGGRNGGVAGGGVTPYTNNQWSNIMQVLGPGNPMGNGGLGSFPGFLPPLAATGFPFLGGFASPGAGVSYQSFQGVPFAGSVGMNAPGGGGIGSWLSGHKTQIAGAGLGLLSRFIPQGGKLGGALSGAAQGASTGAMFGPWGMAIGGALGGIAGLFGGGKAAKNARNAETSQVFEQFSSKEFVALQREADRLGVSMEKALNSKTMKDFGAAVDEVRGKIEEMTALEDEIKSLTEAATVDFDDMNAIVKEFGLDIAKMGPAFQQAAMDKEFQKIIDALAVMEKGGADMNGVLDGMKDEISKVVQDSIKFGTDIPENMKPWIDKLIESGKLVDENGQKITDTSKMKFGAPMESEMDKVVKKLDELIAKLGELTEGFRDAGEAAGDLGNVEYPQPPAGGSTEAHGVSRGGVIGRNNVLYFGKGGFVPRGTDTVPAMLTPGEMVLARDQVKALTRRGAGSNITINLNVAGYLDSPKVQREITQMVVEGIDRDARLRRVG